MKLNFIGLLVFVTISCVTATDDNETPLDVIHEKCQSDPKSKIDEAILDKWRHGETVNDPQLGVHSLCMSKLSKFQNEKGDLNVDFIKGKWSKEYSGEKLNKLYECLVPKTTPEETAWELAKCQYSVTGFSEHELHHHHHDHDHMS